MAEWYMEDINGHQVANGTGHFFSVGEEVVFRTGQTYKILSIKTRVGDHTSMSKIVVKFIGYS